MVLVSAKSGFSCWFQFLPERRVGVFLPPLSLRSIPNLYLEDLLILLCRKKTWKSDAVRWLLGPDVDASHKDEAQPVTMVAHMVPQHPQSLPKNVNVSLTTHTPQIWGVK